MTYPELETLRLERVGPVGWLFNNRPDQLNAMNARMRDEFELAWRALDADPEVRVIVHTGAGRAFQTGVDVSEIASANATFLDPHVSVGQASVYETIALAKKSPMESILRMAFTGRQERISAERAYELGIVSQVVDPPEQLRAEAQALGEKIALNDPNALASVKRALWNALETT